MYFNFQSLYHHFVIDSSKVLKMSFGYIISWVFDLHCEEGYMCSLVLESCLKISLLKGVSFSVLNLNLSFRRVRQSMML